MKKILLLFVMAFMTKYTTAQEFDKTIGVEGQYGIKLSIRGAYFSKTEGLLQNGEIKNSPFILINNFGYQSSIMLKCGNFIYKPGKTLTNQVYSCGEANVVPTEETIYSTQGPGKSTTFFKNGDRDESRGKNIEDLKIDSIQLKQMFDAEVEKARKSIPGFNPELLAQADKIINGSKNPIVLTVSQWQSKKSFTDEDCKNLESAIYNNYTGKDAIQLQTLYITNCCKNDEDRAMSRSNRAFMYENNNQYTNAITDYKFCEQVYKAKNDFKELSSLYSAIAICYKEMGDAVNYKAYLAKSDQAKEKRQAIVGSNTPSLASNSQKNYCFNTFKGNYKISLSDDGSHKGLYLLYDSNGNVTKTLQGIWTLQDEGVYGSTYKLTFEFTGSNANLPSMKFVGQFDGNGKLQALIDNQNRTWNQCN